MTSTTNTPEAKPQWTAPYYGVQHLKPLKQGQASVTSAEGRAEAFVWMPGLTQTSMPKASFSTVEQAKRWAEKKAADLGLVSP